jgi:NAD+ kinase
MSTSTPPLLPVPRSIAVIYQPRIAAARPLAERVARWLKERGLETGIASTEEGGFLQNLAQSGFQMIVALGGDGTMLRAAHAGAPGAIPVLGINLGRLGFLTEFQSKDWEAGFDRLMAGQYWVERRLMLHVECAREGRLLGAWDVLNECAVTRGGATRMIWLETVIDGQPLTTYAADGLIISTPTGSTAYALAAGGPILPPELRNILLIPVAPHLSVERAIVLPDGAAVSVRLRADSPALLSCDGQTPVEVAGGDIIRARAADIFACFARVQGEGYFYRNITTRLNRNPQTDGMSDAAGVQNPSAGETYG